VDTAQKYSKDMDRLIEKGALLTIAMQKEISPDAEVQKTLNGKEITKLPNFVLEYQGWYSESLALLAQVLPERVADFRALYAPAGARKDLTHSTYTISDYLRGTRVTRWDDHVVVDKSAALHPMTQQFSIVQGLARRFTSTLFDIKTLVHADVLDDELHAAEELNGKGFQRGAGAVAGVVLEGHLAAVCDRHRITVRKKDPSIADLNEALKSASVVDVVQWRFVQHLADLRNKCDHKKATEPSREDVEELIAGVRKVTKTVL